MRLNLQRSAQKELDRLPQETAKRISDKILKLKENPYSTDNQKLAGGKGYRIRIGNYRVIYRIDKQNKVVHITKIAHRKEVYR